MTAGKKWNPGSIMELSGHYWKTCTLHAAAALDLFTALGDGRASAGELASRLDLNERALAMLLNALTAMEFLEKRGDLFSNTDGALIFLSKDSPKNVVHMVRHHMNLVDSFRRMPEAIKTGGPVRARASQHDDEAREDFLMGMFNNAMGIAPIVPGLIDLSGKKRLLDLGGGPGVYAMHFCMKNPGLRATVFDLPTSEPFMRRAARRFDVEDRVDFAPGDFLKDDPPPGFDAAWLSHILHAETPEDCQRIVDKTVRAAKPGADVYIHDFILNDTLDGPLFPALFSLNMLLGTPGGQSYSEGQIMDMMKSAGLTDVRRLDFTGPTQSGIATGRVPG